jgi:hypothetical protein
VEKEKLTPARSIEPDTHNTIKIVKIFFTKFPVILNGCALFMSSAIPNFKEAGSSVCRNFDKQLIYMHLIRMIILTGNK